MLAIKEGEVLDPIISIHEAKDLLGKKRVIFADCRYSLQDPSQGIEQYEKEHIPGAVYFDLEQDLSSDAKETGGRHPLPSLDQIRNKLESSGIDPNTTIIAYDDQSSAMASRLLWLMKYMGHSDVFIMDGGFSAWLEQGYPTSTVVYQQEKTTYQPHLHNNLIATQDDVKDKVNQPNVAIIDSRSYERYSGKEEPIDKKAGHIPSAHHYFWKDLFREGHWIPIDELQNRFSDLNHYEEIVVYCGSGVTATPNVVALWRSGFERVRLYVGSWSDWISNPKNDIQTISTEQ